MLNIKGIISCAFYISFTQSKLLIVDNRDIKTLVYSRLSSADDGYITPSPPNCSKLLEQFSDSAANFTKCSIKYARPVQLCEKCVDKYVVFRDKYQDLLKINANGTSCKEIFISHDRLDVVLEYFNNIMSVWNKGNCNGCYNWSNGVPELSNNTKKFYLLFNDTTDCILKNLSPSEKNYTKVCENCMHNYSELNNFYESLSLDPIGLDNICMDVVDAMNATRSIWSKTLNCCKLRQSPEIVFLCCTGIIAMLPLLYYLAVRFCGPIRDLPNVLKQSRFKQTILRSMNRRVD